MGFETTPEWGKSSATQIGGTPYPHKSKQTMGMGISIPFPSARHALEIFKQ